jgi:putative MATE family efflux protein
VQLVGVGCLRAAGRTDIGMTVGVTVNVANLALCWPLTLKFGWHGLAAGASAAVALGGVMTLVWLFRGVGPLRVQRPAWPGPVELWRLLRIGIPAASAMLGSILCHLWFVGIIGGLGEAATAAHGVAVQLEAVGYLICEAFGAAVAALVGQNLGAGRPDLARACARRALAYATVWMAGVGLLFAFGAPWLAGLFAASQEVAANAASAMRRVSISEPALGALIVMMGVFRGSGDTRWLLALNLIGLLGVRVPLAWLLIQPQFGLGMPGAWLAMMADNLLRCGLASWRFRQGGWTRVRA